MSKTFSGGLFGIAERQVIRGFGRLLLLNQLVLMNVVFSIAGGWNTWIMISYDYSCRFGY